MSQTQIHPLKPTRIAFAGRIKTRARPDFEPPGPIQRWLTALLGLIAMLRWIGSAEREP